MKKLNILLLILISCSGISEYTKPIELQWKISNDSTLVYDAYFKNVPEEIKSEIDIEKEIYPQPEEYNITTLLRGNNNDSISIIGFYKKLDYSTSKLNLNDSLKTKEEDAIKQKSWAIRGVIDRNGNNKSFYLNLDTKNMISLLFQLPQNHIKVGESWDLDIQFLQFNQLYICEKANYARKATLAEFDPSNNIATIKYVVIEYFKGKIQSPYGNSGDVDIKITANAIGKFDVKNGCWINFAGVVRINDEMKQYIALNRVQSDEDYSGIK